jgi:hypothetical protein
VAESLFVETLRGYIDSLPPRHLGWLAGLRDPQVGKCLDLIHSHPPKTGPSKASPTGCTSHAAYLRSASMNSLVCRRFNI